MEEVLTQHADVAECAVVGVQDRLKGQVPIGLLVINAGVTRDPEAIAGETVQMVREGDWRRGVLPDRCGRAAASQDTFGKDPAKRHCGHRRRTTPKVPPTIEDPIGP